MLGNVRTHLLFHIPCSFQLSEMRRNTSLGMGYRFSEMNRRISSASDSNIVTRIASRSITGHELPIQVHQHNGLEYHIILKPTNKHDGSNETCMRRGFTNYRNAQKVCLQPEKVHCQDFVRVYMTTDVSCLCLTKSNRVLELNL
jgi:hypothetical protein